MKILQASAVLTNKVGLHARPAAIFVQTAKRFKASLKVKKGDKIADAKSILGVLSLGAECGDEITIIAQGEDAEEALNTLLTLIKNKFGEKE